MHASIGPVAEQFRITTNLFIKAMSGVEAEEAMRRPGPGGFDLKRWHTAALGLGPMGLDGLTEALATAGNGSG